LLQRLILARPDDPIQYLIDYLKLEISHVPVIYIFGPPCSGKRTLGNYISKSLNCVHISSENVKNLEGLYAIDDSESYEPCPSPYYLAITLKKRLLQQDCETRGYVLTGFPETEEQAKALQFEGIYPDIVLVLDTQDCVLIERADGELIDPETGDTYHAIFNPASDPKIAARLERAPGTSPEEMKASLREYHHHFVALKNIYGDLMTTINTDQPLTDVFSQALCRLNRPPRTVAMWTPRVVLLGYSGCGRKTMAQMLAKKYELVSVHCGTLIRTEVLKGSKLGRAMSTYTEARLPVPDPMVIKMLKLRLTEVDCTLKGWVLYGFPRSWIQAELLDSADLEPNRIIVLNIPHSEAAVRLTGRRVDAVTGETYHLCHKPPPEGLMDQPKRIGIRPRTSDCEISTKLSRFAAQRDELMKFYGSRLSQVNADRDIPTVFESVEAAITKPLPYQTDS
uniref:Nucleoside-diphosphate kinase n=3 Tax=Schistocephalus solidus TaxID=70667 RepID=A0A183SKS5_SCHSO